MRFAVIFTLGGLSLLWLASWLDGWHWLLAWPGLNLLVLAVIYGTDSPHWLGKRPNGSLSVAHVLPMASYFVFTWLVWRLFRRITPEPPSNEVAPNLHVGRRPLPGELPPDTCLVVDLTAEFRAHPDIQAQAEVHCLPTLDALGPSPEALPALIQHIRAQTGPVYIHCAAGHGRSATLAAAVLLDRKAVATIDQAERLMQASRPAIHLHRAQRRVLEILYPASAAR